MKTVVVRVVEWSAWLPQQKEKTAPLMMSHGITGFQAEDDEKVLEVAVSATGRTHHFAMQVPIDDEDAESDTEVRNIPHGLYAFQAILAKNAPADYEIPVAIPTDGEQNRAVILPGTKNREERRKEQKGKKKS